MEFVTRVSFIEWKFPKLFRHFCTHTDYNLQFRSIKGCASICTATGEPVVRRRTARLNACARNACTISIRFAVRMACRMIVRVNCKKKAARDRQVLTLSTKDCAIGMNTAVSRRFAIFRRYEYEFEVIVVGCLYFRRMR